MTKGWKLKLPGLLDNAGKGDGDRANEGSRDRWPYRGPDLILILPGWKAMPAVASKEGKNDKLDQTRH